jgi:membrane-bound lytic murein transglycosylase B
MKNFIDDMVRKHDFNSVKLVTLFSKVRPRPDIIKAISNPAEAKPWFQYRKIFLTESRIKGGVAFWKRHAKVLARAYKVYGVAPEYIVAIIGVETRYGKYKGHYPVIEALTTLAFDYPKRGRFFRRELEQYLLLTREEKINPLKLKGSYAGAMGGPQFISSSYRRYAVDFDNDGKRDLLNNTTDMIGSVANYFHVHGWRRGAPVTTRALIKGTVFRSLLKLGVKPHTSLYRMKRYGVVPKGGLTDEHIAAIIELETKKGHEYWLGMNNFYVITRYNRSPLYAMAVHQLAREIARRYRQKHPLK